LVPIITTREVTESDKECHASAIMATEPVTIPAQYFNPNNKKFTIKEITPSR
jgi:hypothetical protein